MKAAVNAPPLRLVTPDEVRLFRTWLAPYVDSLAQNVTDTLPPNVRTAWQAFATGWAGYCADDPSWTRAPKQLQDGQEFARLVLLWKTVLSKEAGAAATESSGAQRVNWWTWSSEVNALKSRLDPWVMGMDQSVASCPTVPDDARKNWLGFVSSWREYFQKDPGWIDNSTLLDQGYTFERDIMSWQRKLAQYKCSKAGPDLHVQVNEPYDDPNKKKEPKEKSEWAPVIMTVAIAGTIMAGLAFAGKFTPGRAAT